MKDHHELAMEEHARRATWMEVYGGYARDMTLRDHYLGLVVQALLSHPDSSSCASPEIFAHAACTMADAMLKARDAE